MFLFKTVLNVFTYAFIYKLHGYMNFLSIDNYMAYKINKRN